MSRTVRPSTINERDVCVLGAGASGMSAAVFLKDAGYSVVVFESTSHLGGQCETFKFTTEKDGQANWIDIGVQAFVNTSSANAAGLGPFTVDTVAFVERFAGEGSAVPLVGYSDPTRYAVNLAQKNEGYILVNSSGTTSSLDFQLAYYRLLTVVGSYPWLDTAKVPTPVPEELLLPFSDFITKYQLEPIVSSILVPYLFFGGLGDFDRLTTLYALLNLSPTISRVFTASEAGFMVTNGCQSIYQGIRDYLGEENVIMNAQVTNANRPLSGAVTISGVVSGAESFSYTCGKLIVSYAQVPEKLTPLNLDETESAVFQNVKSRYYFAGEIRLAGPLNEGNNFDISNLNSNGTTPVLPAITEIFRARSYGPAQVKASSNDLISLSSMTDVVKEQLSRLPSGLVTGVTLVDLVYHTFQPYFTTDELAKTNGSYTALANLQGYRNTYYVGSLGRFAASFLVWEDSYQLIEAHFPPQEEASSAGQVPIPIPILVIIRIIHAAFHYLSFLLV